MVLNHMFKNNWPRGNLPRGNRPPRRDVKGQAPRYEQITTALMRFHEREFTKKILSSSPKKEIILLHSEEEKRWTILKFFHKKI